MNYYIKFETGQYMGYHGRPAGMNSAGIEKRYPYPNEAAAKRALKRYKRLYPDWMGNATIERAAW